MSQDYIPLATVTLASATSTVSFSNIPATPYRDLVLIMNVSQNTTSARSALMRPNNDSANGSLVYIDGYGTNTGSGTTAAMTAYYIQNGVSANIVTTSINNIMEYRSTDRHKTSLTRAGSAGGPVSAYVSRWASTSAITSLTIVVGEGGNWNIGSTFSLYGIVG